MKTNQELTDAVERHITLAWALGGIEGAWHWLCAKAICVRLRLRRAQTTDE